MLKRNKTHNRKAYTPPISLWRLVEQFAPQTEKEEIKNMLGDSLIDQSLELHEEIETLLEIWRDYRDETTRTTPKPILPEPPGLRGRLVQEIQFFVDNVKDKAKSQGVNPDKILSRHNTEVLDYALDTYRSDSRCGQGRPMTARGAEGRETPMMVSPTCSGDRVSAASTLSEEVESMNDKLTILKFDEVVSHLRSTLEEETETLVKDISFLQGCLEEEADFRAESTGTLRREPTITDLREERSNLERDMLSNMKSQTSPTNLKPAFNSPLIKPLGPNLSQSSKMKSSSTNRNELSALKTKSGPMRAFTSPDNPVGGSTSHPVPSGPIRLKQDERLSQGSTDREKMLYNKNPSLKQKTDYEREALSKELRLNLGSSGDGGDRSIKNSNSEKSSKMSRPSLPHGRPSPVRAVLLSKDNAGETTPDVHMVPSPPSSAKPSSARPSSAQRFRKMVAECRD